MFVILFCAFSRAVADKYPPVALSIPASDDLSSALPNRT
jgi:hypothetical protein